MTAAALLARAEAAGVRLEAAGDRLRLLAAKPPPPALLHDLAGAKGELLALLECRADEAAERAAILAEPPMPPPGTPERERLDREQTAWLAGLRKAAAIRPHRSQSRE
jgi:hypothetical protein